MAELCMRGAFEFDSGRAHDGSLTRVTVTRVLLPFEEGGGWVVRGLRRGQRQYMMMNSEDQEDVFKDDEVDRLKLLV